MRNHMICIIIDGTFKPSHYDRLDEIIFSADHVARFFGCQLDACYKWFAVCQWLLEPPQGPWCCWDSEGEHASQCLLWHAVVHALCWWLGGERGRCVEQPLHWWEGWFADRGGASLMQICYHWRCIQRVMEGGLVHWMAADNGQNPNTRLVSRPHHTRARAEASPHRCDNAHRLCNGWATCNVQVAHLDVWRQDWWGSVAAIKHNSWLCLIAGM